MTNAQFFSLTIELRTRFRIAAYNAFSTMFAMLKLTYLYLTLALLLSSTTIPFSPIT
jgi:hypothetical protein